MSCGRHMAQMEASHMRLPTSLPGHTHAAAFVHVSHLMGGVHQRGGRRAAHRAAHRGAVGPERSGRSILKLTSLCRCAGPREAAFCILGAMRHRGCNGISGRVSEHRAARGRSPVLAYTQVFFGLRRYYEPQISLRRPLILNKFDQKFSSHVPPVVRRSKGK